MSKLAVSYEWQPGAVNLTHCLTRPQRGKGKGKCSLKIELRKSTLLGTKHKVTQTSRHQIMVIEVVEACAMLEVEVKDEANG